MQITTFVRKFMPVPDTVYFKDVNKKFSRSVCVKRIKKYNLLGGNFVSLLTIVIIKNIHFALKLLKVGDIIFCIYHDFIVQSASA